MLIKIHKSYRDVIAICDSELIWKKFEQGKFQLDVKESFYKGNEKTPEQTIKIIQEMSKEDATFNIIGEKSVNSAIKAGIISKEGVLEIQKIPYALGLL